MPSSPSGCQRAHRRRVDDAGLVDLGGDSAAARADYFPDDPLHSEGCAQIEAETRGAKRAAERPLVPAGVSAVAAGSDPQPPAAVPADQNAELLARAKSAEEKLAELEAELAALKAQQILENSSNFHDDSSAPEARSTEEAHPKAEAAGTAASRTVASAGGSSPSP